MGKTDHFFMITYVTDDGLHLEVEEKDIKTVYESDDGFYKVDHYVYYLSNNNENVTVGETYLVSNKEQMLIGGFHSCADAVMCILSRRLCDVL